MPAAARATLFQGCFADEPDLDGYRNVSVSLRGGVNVTDALTLEGHFLNADADNEYDGSIFGGNEAENTQRVAGGKLTWNASDRVKLTVQAGRADDKSDAYYRDAATPDIRTFVNTFDTQRDTAAVQADFTLAEGQLLTAGGDWQQDDITSTTGFSVDSRDNTGAFVEYQGRSAPTSCRPACATTTTSSSATTSPAVPAGAWRSAMASASTPRTAPASRHRPSTICTTRVRKART